MPNGRFDDILDAPVAIKRGRFDDILDAEKKSSMPIGMFDQSQEYRAQEGDRPAPSDMPSFTDVLAQPGATLQRGLSRIRQNPIAGVADIGSAAIGTVALPFSLADITARKMGAERLANIVAAPFEAIGVGVRKGTELIQKGVEAVGVPEEVQRLGLSEEKAKEAAQSVSELSQGLAQFVIPAAVKPAIIGIRAKIRRGSELSVGERNVLKQNGIDPTSPDVATKIDEALKPLTAEQQQAGLTETGVETKATPVSEFIGKETKKQAEKLTVPETTTKRMTDDEVLTALQGITTASGLRAYPDDVIIRMTGAQRRALAEAQETQPPVQAAGEAAKPPIPTTPKEAVVPSQEPPPPTPLTSPSVGKGILALKTRDGKVYSDKNATLHSQIVEKNAIPETRIADVGYLDENGEFVSQVKKPPIAPQKPIEPLKPPQPPKTVTEQPSAPISEPQAIPKFNSTEEAIAFGEKATPEEIAKLQEIRQQKLEEVKNLTKEKKPNEAIKAATDAQFAREAIEVNGKKSKPAIGGRNVQKVSGVVEETGEAMAGNQPSVRGLGRRQGSPEIQSGEDIGGMPKASERKTIGASNQITRQFDDIGMGDKGTATALQTDFDKLPANLQEDLKFKLKMAGARGDRKAANNLSDIIGGRKQVTVIESQAEGQGKFVFPYTDKTPQEALDAFSVGKKEAPSAASSAEPTGAAAPEPAPVSPQKQPWEMTKEEIARDMIRKHPKYQELLASKRRYIRSMYSAEETNAKMKEIELEPEDLLSAHAGVMNRKSQSSVKMKALADEIFRDTKLPRRPKGTFRGEDYRIAWDEFNPQQTPAQPTKAPPQASLEQPKASKELAQLANEKLDVSFEGGGYRGWITSDQGKKVAVNFGAEQAELRAEFEKLLADPEYINRLNRDWASNGLTFNNLKKSAKPSQPKASTEGVESVGKMSFEEFLTAPRQGALLEGLRKLPKRTPTAEEVASKARIDKADEALRKAGLSYVIEHPSEASGLPKNKQKLWKEYADAWAEEGAIHRKYTNEQQKWLYDRAVESGLIEKPPEPTKPAEPLSPSKLQEAKEAAPKVGMTPKEMKKTLLGELERVKDSDAVKEYEKIRKRFVGAEQKAPLREKFSQDVDAIVEKLKAEGFDADVFEPVMSNQVRTPRVVVHIPGDGSFYTPINEIGTALEKLKNFPTTTSTTAPAVDLGGVKASSPKVFRGNVNRLGDFYIVDGKVAIRGETPKGFKPSDQPLSPKAKETLADWMKEEKQPAERLGYVEKDADFGTESVSKNPVPGEHAFAIYKIGEDKYLVTPQSQELLVASKTEPNNFAASLLGMRLYALKGKKVESFIQTISAGMTGEGKIWTREQINKQWGEKALNFLEGEKPPTTPSFTKSELNDILKPFLSIVGGKEEARAAAGLTKSELPVAQTPENIQLRQALEFIEKNPKLDPFKPSATNLSSTIIPGITQKQMERLGDRIAGAFQSAYAEIENQRKIGTLKSDRVKEYLVSNIPKDATPKEKAAAIALAHKAQVQIRRQEVADRIAARRYKLAEDAADRIISQTIPAATQKKLLETANQFRVSSDTQGKFTAKFKSRVAAMADSYGAAGGELANRTYMGDITRSHFMEKGYDAVGKIKDIYDEVKNPFEKQAISDAVINALENRENAKSFLDTPEKQQVYDHAVGLLDDFRKELGSRGYETRENYFTHIQDVDVLEQVLDGIGDARKEKPQNLNSFITEKSRFLKPRTDAKIEIKKDLPSVLSTYVRSVSKELAYKDAVEYYYTEFQKDIPAALKSNSMDRAMQLMRTSLNPEKGRGVFFRTANWIRNQQYRNFLGLNLKASAQNLTQVDFAKMRWIPEAEKLRQLIWIRRKEVTGPLADAVEVASSDTPRFLEMLKEPGQEATQTTVTEKFNKIDTFQKSEGRNWRQTELGSILNSVMKDPRYKQLETKYSGDQIRAINEMLRDQEVFDKAVREAAATSAETQVSSSPSMRGEFFDTPFNRLIGMFTAFKTRQLQIFGETLGKQEGINGTRAKMIMRRGMSGDVAPVEVLREVEITRKAMEKMVSEAKKHKQDIGVPRQQAQEYVDYLKKQERELNDIIKQIEPAGGSTANRAATMGRYFAKIAAISMSFSLLWDFVDSAVYGDEDKEKNMVARALKKAVVDVWPAPFYGSNPAKFLVSPVAPNFENADIYGNFSGRGLARDVFSYSLNAIPFGGLIDRATGKRISKAAIDLVVPKKQPRRRAVSF